MIKILFVCHGNICRSPMAEFVMKEKVSAAGLESDYEIASAATSTEEIGNPVYPPVRRLLNAAGINCSEKRARQMTRKDYAYYDYIVYMDSWNKRNILRIIGEDTEGKLHRMLDFTDMPGDIADPWYTGDFNLTWDQVNLASEALLEITQKESLY